MRKEVFYMNFWKSYVIPEYPAYTITSEMDVYDKMTKERLTWHSESNITYVILDRYHVIVPIKVLYVMTFIGYAPFEIYNDGHTYTYKIPADMNTIDDDTLIMNGEYFKRIPGFSNYFISLKGVVFNRKRFKFMIRSYTDEGIARVSMTDDYGNRAPRRLYKLMYVTFVGRIPCNMQVYHKDGRQWNHHPDNLKIAEAPNLAHLKDEKDIFSDPPERGSLPDKPSRQYKLTSNDVICIRQRVAAGEDIRKLSDEYGCAKNIIERIRDRKIWKNV